MSTHGQGSTNKGNQKGGDQKPKVDESKGKPPVSGHSNPPGPGKGRTPSQGK